MSISKLPFDENHVAIAVMLTVACGACLDTKFPNVGIAIGVCAALFWVYIGASLMLNYLDGDRK